MFPSSGGTKGGVVDYADKIRTGSEKKVKKFKNLYVI
jgi:hypothetical protein